MRQKNTNATNWLSNSDPIEIAAELSRLEPEKRAEIFQRLPAELTDAVFWQFEPDHQAAVLESLHHDQVIRLLENMDPDDRVHLFQVMPADLISRLMTQLSPRERRSTELLLAYPKETAGRIMNPEFIWLKPGMTVSAALVRPPCAGGWTACARRSHPAPAHLQLRYSKHSGNALIRMSEFE